ncbi:DNA-binding Xre family transcriptional regulator [Breznakia sp. PF5-3]|uniref:hypothetical protein n=1 Tax=unclassified Breznakia TaxID=2623764 RepID=UPI002406DA35|nr:MULTISPECIES: hypothetical protein [unclassified Breznakia]MDF9825200.1 DNA-binding Xre family transcriptional regulator [Breznakia sp. PM6-1]MDF9836058.1 DNA-binding Xre family transcriptional regulator [Breznakia sp. PF5-3]MDF9838874.1 DNA-binding Xre family transcriptional regulator [Breznakia sp. PFB2-8]MDF9860900.1 DNA-binding Xre family transcriptional regulator [Breznakia sp. PH5-24]
MIITNQIKALLALQGKTYTDLAKFQSVTLQNVSNKARKNSWSKKDLFDIAKFTNTNLAYVDKDGKPIFVLEADD